MATMRTWQGLMPLRTAALAGERAVENLEQTDLHAFQRLARNAGVADDHPCGAPVPVEQPEAPPQTSSTETPLVTNSPGLHRLNLSSRMPGLWEDPKDEHDLGLKDIFTLGLLQKTIGGGSGEAPRQCSNRRGGRVLAIAGGLAAGG